MKDFLDKHPLFIYLTILIGIPLLIGLLTGSGDFEGIQFVVILAIVILGGISLLTEMYREGKPENYVFILFVIAGIVALMLW